MFLCFTDETQVEVLSLEEIHRQKALESMKRARGKQCVLMVVCHWSFEIYVSHCCKSVLPVVIKCESLLSLCYPKQDLHELVVS